MVKISRYPLAVVAHIVLSNARVVSTLHCATAAPCAGTVSTLYAHRLHAATGSIAGAKRKATVIAADPFFSIPGHHTAAVAQKLTKAGRLLLRRGTPLKAIEQVTSISLGGKATTRSLHLTLRRSRSR